MFNTYYLIGTKIIIIKITVDFKKYSLLFMLLQQEHFQEIVCIIN